MSGATSAGGATNTGGTAGPGRRLGWLPGRETGPMRLLAVLAVLLLLAAPLSVLYTVADVAGDPSALTLAVASALVAGTFVGRVASVRTAVLVAGATLIVGGGWYFLTLPNGVEVLTSVGLIVRDTAALLTGLSVLQITNAGQWALAVAPGPTFLAWYLAIRRRYVLATAVAGGLLGVFVLTGDAGMATTLLGVVAATATVALGDAERRGASPGGTDVIAVLLAVMVVLTLVASVVPAGLGEPFQPQGDGAGGPTVEGSLVSAGDRTRILGSISLTPTVRYTVTSERSEYWQVAAYDRYTGDGWLRTGNLRVRDPDSGSRSGPPGPSTPVVQSYEAESGIDTMPAAWRPVDILGGSAADRGSFTVNGNIEPSSSLSEGDSYAVESEVLGSSPGQLRSAGRDYPDAIEARYLQVPSSTPDRVGERAERITALADNRYDTAKIIERWLENNKRYSLDVERPDGNVADAFLFEREAGYCTYFATTMVTMLRTQGIPARFAVGYTPGERVARDEWVVRGLDSHAWVQAYFPAHGWVRFDPTPAGPREDAERERLETARASGQSGVDTDRTRGEEWTPTPTTPIPDTPTPDTPTPAVTATAGNGSTPEPFGTPVGGGDGWDPDLPSREQVGLGLVVVVGAAAGLRRSGAAGRAYREAWLASNPSGTPTERVTSAWRRVEYLLERTHRDRRPGETVRQYATVTDDERVHRLAGLYERARYAGEATEEEADEAVEVAATFAGERTWRERLDPRP